MPAVRRSTLVLLRREWQVFLNAQTLTIQSTNIDEISQLRAEKGTQFVCHNLAGSVDTVPWISGFSSSI